MIQPHVGILPNPDIALAPGVPLTATNAGLEAGGVPESPESVDPHLAALTEGPGGWAFFEALIRSMPVVPYIDAPDERRTYYVAPQVTNVFGIDAAQYVAPNDDPLYDHLHPDDRDSVIAEIFRLLDEGGGTVEYRYIRPDTGETVWIEDRFTVIEVDGRRMSPGVFMDVTRQKLDAARIAEQMQTLEQIDAVSQRFSDLVVGSGDVTAIVRTLADVLDARVSVMDAHGYEIAHEGVASDDGLSEYPIILRGDRWGTLRVHRAVGSSQVASVAIDRASTAIALALLVEREASLLAETARTSLVNDLVMERITSGREFRRRSRALGVELGRDPLCVFILEPVSRSQNRSRGRLRLRDAAATRLTRSLDELGCRALVATEGERVVAVIAAPSSLDVRTVAVTLAQTSARGGLSSIVDGDDVVRGYHQAVDALHHAAQRLPDEGVGQVVPFDDLGLTLLLQRMADGPELRRFIDSELGALTAHDRSHGSHLVATLQAYLAENGSKTATAKRLHVERRTIYYRLDRISALLAHDLDDPETRLRLDLALRGLTVTEGATDG